MKNYLLLTLILLSFISCREYTPLLKNNEIKNPYKILSQDLTSFGGAETFIIAESAITDNMQLWIAPDNRDYKDKSEFKIGIEFSTLEKKENGYVLKTPVKEGVYQIYIFTESGEIKKESDYKIYVDRSPIVTFEEQAQNTVYLKVEPKNYGVNPDFYRMSVKDKKTGRYYLLENGYHVQNSLYLKGSLNLHGQFEGDIEEFALTEVNEENRWMEFPLDFSQFTFNIYTGTQMDLEFQFEAKYNVFFNILGNDLSWSSAQIKNIKTYNFPLINSVLVRDSNYELLGLKFVWQGSVESTKYRYRLHWRDKQSDEKWYVQEKWTELEVSQVEIDIKEFNYNHNFEFLLEVQEVTLDGSWSESYISNVLQVQK